MRHLEDYCSFLLYSRPLGAPSVKAPPRSYILTQQQPVAYAPQLRVGIRRGCSIRLYLNFSVFRFCVVAAESDPGFCWRLCRRRCFARSEFSFLTFFLYNLKVSFFLFLFLLLGIFRFVFLFRSIFCSSIWFSPNYSSTYSFPQNFHFTYAYISAKC